MINKPAALRMTSPAPHDEDNERAARRSNVAAIIGVFILVVVSYWAFSALEHSRRFQRCLDSGRRNCVDYVDQGK
jgi:hypothetical protein